MKRFLIGLLVGLGLALPTGVYLGYHNSPVNVSVSFSPRGGITADVIELIRTARKSILVSAYSFTSQPITNALIAAAKSGVDVAMVVDDSQLGEDDSTIEQLRDAGVRVFIDSKHAIHHNKIVVIDGVIVGTGSFNFSKSAEERNAENFVIIYDAILASKYVANFELHLSHSKSEWKVTHGKE